ncbi:GNAT family N-acetyltransferase [Oceanibium sediminis]|uniref:GNAT family N-acetyltransferase n=1 Tax=Oceanibium sediminis TaxID=2026339 RepID=UPI000DD2D08D
MDDSDKFEISVLAAISAVPAEEWDACANPAGGWPEDPFTLHKVLAAFEDSGSVGPGTGWQARHLVARFGGQVVAVMPLYAKGHSQGEYIFDHNWAHAYERAGGRYYPKLQSCVPFTPATGRRFLTRPGWESQGFAALVQGALQLTTENRLSSFHCTFCTEAEWQMGGEMGLLQRTGQQFHWLNRDYADFDAFLADLNSRKRKTIRKERRTAQAFGGTIRRITGADFEPAHWDAFWEFYQDTGARKWGTPYLTRQFFEIANAEFPELMMMVLAERGGTPVAGALNFIGRETLYGRYWGCREEIACLHFEACYYQAIDWAIEHGLSKVEAGAQGGHKLARGYLPVPTYSLHWMADEGFARAVEQYLEAERDAVDEEIEVLTSYGPFRKVEGEP